MLAVIVPSVACGDWEQGIERLLLSNLHRMSRIELENMDASVLNCLQIDMVPSYS
jgi:hypothetical protein